MHFVIMTVDSTSQFCFAYAPFQMCLLSVPAGKGAVGLTAERIKNELNLLQERWEGKTVNEYAGNKIDCQLIIDETGGCEHEGSLYHSLYSFMCLKFSVI